MKKKIIISTILLLSLCISPEFNAATPVLQPGAINGVCISPEFNAATPKEKHDNSTNKSYLNLIEFQLTQGIIVIPAATYTVKNTYSGLNGIYLPPPDNAWLVEAGEGHVIRFNLFRLATIKQYTVTAQDAQSGFVTVDLLTL